MIQRPLTCLGQPYDTYRAPRELNEVLEEQWSTRTRRRQRRRCLIAWRVSSTMPRSEKGHISDTIGNLEPDPEMQTQYRFQLSRTQKKATYRTLSETRSPIPTRK